MLQVGVVLSSGSILATATLASTVPGVALDDTIALLNNNPMVPTLAASHKLPWYFVIKARLRLPF